MFYGGYKYSLRIGGGLWGRLELLIKNWKGYWRFL